MVFFRICFNPLVWRVLAVMALVVLLYGGLREDPIPMYVSNFDKWTHIAGFFGITLAAGMGFPRLHSLWLLLAMGTLGYLIELIQSEWLPLRTFSWLDLSADLTGVALALLLLWPLRQSLRQSALSCSR